MAKLFSKLFGGAKQASSSAREGLPIYSETRADAWANVDLGYGTALDKRSSTIPTSRGRLNDAQLTALYNEDDIAARIVDECIENALDQGYSVTQKTGEIADEPSDFRDRLGELARWGRLYGGALLLVGGTGGGEMNKPLPVGGYRSVTWLRVIDRRYISVGRYNDDANSPRFGEPETYLIGDGHGNAYRYVEVHASRCVRWDGVDTDRMTKASLHTWGYSVLQRPYEVIRDYSLGFSALSVLLSDAAQGVFKISGLIDAIASGAPGAQLIQQRMRIVDRTRSALRSVLVDADKEEFTRIATPFSGIPEAIDRLNQRLSAATGIPISRIMGRLGSTMGANSDSEERAWNSRVASFQVRKLTPAIKAFHAMLGREVEVKWPALWAPTAKESAEIEELESRADAAYVDMGIVTPAEVAQRRLTPERGWGFLDLRAKVAELEQAESIDVDLSDLELPRNE